MKSMVLMILLSVGVAVVAAPTEVDDRIEYTTSLNSMAATVMNWYGSLISTKEHVSFSAIEKVWDDYRSRYPDNITQIKITSTDLIKLDESDQGVSEQYQFNVNSLFTYKKSDGDHSELLSETFIFQVEPFARPDIKNISRVKTEKTEIAQTSEFNRSHYKAREFAYVWLAYLDGVDVLKSEMYADQWLDQAIYSMKIGGEELQGSVLETLAERKQYLAKGGHLLRSLDLIKIENNKFILDLILEWKGINKNGKPVLAKIHQKIEYQLLEDNSWKVISIKEEHLLPDIAPWTGLLC